ncbi:MAG: polysaccharide biosynthesis C-terminal domain-containing protein [Saprospiraceae bacterium]|nr:polysaccharide biosynthesis C-terminal domain-containing protein [Saprospiraceae bacterium]
MSWSSRLQLLITDPVRQVQFFMLCRQSGVLLSSIVIARYLPLDQVGGFEMLMLCGYLMTFFWSDAFLKGYLASPFPRDNPTTTATFLWFYLILSLVAMAVLMLGQRVLLPLLVHRPSLDGLGLFTIYQALIIPVWVAPFIGLLKGRHSLLLSAFVLVGPTFACIVGWMSIPSLTGILIGLLSYALVGLVWVMLNSKFIRELRLKSMFVDLWPATWPLIMYAVSIGIARSFDAWLVARHFDEASFAIFRYGAREFPLVIAFAAGLSTIMIPRLKGTEALAELRFRSTRLMHICYPSVAVVMFLSPVLFQQLFGIAYKESALIFNIYLLLTLTQLVFPQTVLMARGDTKVLWYISLAELMVNVVASLVLLYWYGLIGIVWGTLIAFIFEKIVLLVYVRNKYGIQTTQLMNYKVLMGYAVLLTVIFIGTKWMFGI